MSLLSRLAALALAMSLLAPAAAAARQDHHLRRANAHAVIAPWRRGVLSRILSEYAVACAETRACREETDDLRATVLEVLSRPDFAVAGERVDMDRVRAAAAIELRRPETAYRLFAAIIEARDGDGRALLALSRRAGAASHSSAQIGVRGRTAPDRPLARLC